MEVERVRNRGRRILYSTKEETDRQTDRQRKRDGGTEMERVVRRKE